MFIVNITGPVCGTSGNYTLATSVSGQRSITLNPSGGSYPSGTTVTLTANPAVGWRRHRPGRRFGGSARLDHQAGERNPIAGAAGWIQAESVRLAEWREWDAQVFPLTAPDREADRVGLVGRVLRSELEDLPHAGLR